MSRFVNVSNLPIKVIILKNREDKPTYPSYECTHIKGEDEKSLCENEFENYPEYFIVGEQPDIEILGECKKPLSSEFHHCTICRECLRVALKEGIIEGVSDEDYIKMLQERISKLMKDQKNLLTVIMDQVKPYTYKKIGRS